MKRLGIAAVAAALLMAISTPAHAAALNQPERNCHLGPPTGSVLVGIKSTTTGTTTHTAFHNPPGAYQTGSWNNGATYKVRGSVSNHYHLFDSQGFGSRVTFTAVTSAYNYCTNFA